MIDDHQTTVPVWALTTREAHQPLFADGAPLSADRLSELRGVLAALVDQPVATLEAHRVPDGLDRSRGIALAAASPLARHLSQLIEQTTRRAPTLAPNVNGEVLYRMVIPAKVAKEFGKGLVRTTSSKGIPGGITSALRDSRGIIVAGGTFVPVGQAASAGAAGAAGTAALGGTALTVAAPLILMAVAVGASAYADHQRQQATERITHLLEHLRDDALDDERSDLDGCRDAIEKATAILLDRGTLGVSLGLDSAVHAIGKALAGAERRSARWQSVLDRLPADASVELGTVTDAFPGVDDDGGAFRAHLELAALAIALKRRVIVLQAVEHAQRDPGNAFEHFAGSLKGDQQRLDQLESCIAGVLMRLSSLEITRPGGRVPAFTAAQVDRLLRATSNIRRLGNGVTPDDHGRDVTIEIARSGDGSVVVLPALAA